MEISTPITAKPRHWLSVVVVSVIAASAGFAVLFQDRGFPFPWAVGFGAFCGVFLVTQGIGIAFTIRRMLWRRQRGYPFMEGDLVEITSGADRGRRGHIRRHDLGSWHYQIRLTADDGEANLSWLSANQLRKVATSPSLAGAKPDADGNKS